MIDKADSWIESETGHAWRTQQTGDEYHDGKGLLDRPDSFVLDNWPVLSVVKLEYWDGNVWVQGREGHPNENPSSQTFHVNRPEGCIYWYSLQRPRRHAYRVTYNWGYPTVPDHIRDLSARKAALLVLDFWAGRTMPAEDVNRFRERFSGEIANLLSTARRHHK